MAATELQDHIRSLLSAAGTSGQLNHDRGWTPAALTTNVAAHSRTKGRSNRQQPVYWASALLRSSDGDGMSADDASAFTVQDSKRDMIGILLPILILLSTLLFLLVFFLVFIIILKARKRRGIALQDTDGPIDLAREEQLEGEGGVAGIESRWLEQQDEATRAGYDRAKVWQQQYNPNSIATEITLSQFLSIQEKGVSAWSFEPDYETNSPLFVTSRTEITFLEDGIGMAPQEGGACCVQSNLPLPRLNEVYYWECKVFEKPASTNLGIGLTTKPYPSFRMPGWNRYSVGYHSADGFKSHNFPFTAQSYGPPLSEGDVLGVGYRPRTGAIFFTRNGKKLEEAYIGMTKHNLFPTVAADGQCTVHVNLGQAGFVFIEANVKKWGLAPMIGTLAPPPAYGSERGSILLETADGPRTPPHPQAAQQPTYGHHSRQRSNEAAAVAALQPDHRSEQLPHPRRHHSHPASSGQSHRRIPSGSTIPIRPSPLRASMTRRRTGSYDNSPATSPVSIPGTLEELDDEDHRHSDEDDDMPHNPPTPGQLDISLRSLSPFSRRHEVEDDEERQAMLPNQQSDRGSLSRNPDQLITGHAASGRQRHNSSPNATTPAYSPIAIAPPRRGGDVSPPTYQLLDANQYPAGVAEAMLDSMPEDQLAALFNTARSGSPAGASYENRMDAAAPHAEQSGGQTLHGLFSGVFSRS